MFPFIQIETKVPIAFDSPDHLFPHGTAQDNSKNLRFNKKLFTLFEFLKRPIRILDLGCSGGGFVRTCIDQGHFAIGLEGSDYSKKHLRAEWATLSDRFLFTADISYPFQVLEKNQPLQFDVITSWEVLEHIPEARLPLICENIKKHLTPQGLVILSISPNEEILDGQHLHVTVKNLSWWIDFFTKNNLFHLPEFLSYFNTQYIRGPKQDAPGTFHLILTQNKALVPTIPKISLQEWLLDRWHLSKPQKFLQKIVLGQIVS